MIRLNAKQRCITVKGVNMWNSFETEMKMYIHLTDLKNTKKQDEKYKTEV